MKKISLLFLSIYFLIFAPSIMCYQHLSSSQEAEDAIITAIATIDDTTVQQNTITDILLQIQHRMPSGEIEGHLPLTRSLLVRILHFIDIDQLESLLGSIPTMNRPLILSQDRPTDTPLWGEVINPLTIVTIHKLVLLMRFGLFINERAIGENPTILHHLIFQTAAAAEDDTTIIPLTLIALDELVRNHAYLEARNNANQTPLEYARDLLDWERMQQSPRTVIHHLEQIVNRLERWQQHRDVLIRELGFDRVNNMRRMPLPESLPLNEPTVNPVTSLQIASMLTFEQLRATEFVTALTSSIFLLHYLFSMHLAMGNKHAHC